MNQKTKKLTRLQLERKLLESQSSHPYAYHFATHQIDKASTEHLMAGACMLQITAIGGKNIIDPVMIKDGLSVETIEMIKKDLKRSYENVTIFKI